MIMKLLKTAIKATIEAGTEIIILYKSGLIETNLKADNTPVTNADMAANKVINEYLKKTDIPIISEENKAIPYIERKKWHRFWLVDPLDGTKEFIQGNGEFTVNIALINNGEPALGVIYAPVTGELYFGMSDIGSFKTSVKTAGKDTEKLIQLAKKLPFPGKGKRNIVAISRSHMNKETEDFIQLRAVKDGKPEIVTRGSSLKICMVAEGTALYYPRFGPTMEWDIAAGHAIAKFASKSIKQIQNKEDINYNKENLVNPDFIVE